MTHLEDLQQQYATQTVPLSVGGRQFAFLLPADLDRFLDGGVSVDAFPLWAKIWQASLVLADLLADRPVKPGERVLEIGCGIGVVGIVAAAFGHDVTLTEHDPHALAFARANAEANGLPSLAPEPLDWNRPDRLGGFDLLVGSEVVYREADFDPLLRLFGSLVNPGGEVLLAAEIRPSFFRFLRRAETGYAIRVLKRTLRSEDESVSVAVARLRAR